MKRRRESITIGTYRENDRTYRVDVDIAIDAKGELHISGMLWDTRRTSDCEAAGQITGELALITDYAPGWDRAKVERLVQVWDRWHLNHLRAACEHQRAAGWEQRAGIQVTIYHYRLRAEIAKRINDTEREALQRLRAGETVRLDQDALDLAKLPREVSQHYQKADSDTYYEPRTPLYAGGRPETEQKTLGWLSPDQHPEGLLCRPCPECGYKYGSAWLKEELPQEVIDFISEIIAEPAAV